jgi:hypothetical protein
VEQPISMGDVSEFDSTPALSPRSFLLGARPVAGALGASGLKLLACSWFAIGLGTLTLLPGAGSARQTVRIAPAGPRADAGVTELAQPSADRVPASRSQLSARRHPPHATPAEPAAGVATLDAPNVPAAETPDPPTGNGGSAAPPAGSATPQPAASTDAGETPEPPPEPPSVLDVVTLPPPPTLPAPPPVPQLPLPDVSDATSSLGLP